MRGITYRYGSSFLTADGGRPLFLTALFPAAADLLGLVSDFVADAYWKKQGLETLPESMIQAVRDAFSPENIYLTEGGLAVFYQPGAIAPVADGVSVFTMPYDEAGPFDPAVLVGE